MPSGAIPPHPPMSTHSPTSASISTKQQPLSPACSSWKTYPLTPRDLHRLTRVGGPTEIVFHIIQTILSFFSFRNIVSTIHFQLTDGYFSPTAWFLLLASLFSITAAIGYGLLAWWARTASVQEEIKMSVRLAHVAAVEAAQVQAQVQARAAQSDARISSSSLWSLAEKSSPTSSSALTSGHRSKILRISAFVLCPLPRVCILLGLVALTMLASLLQGYRIRKGTHCSLYEEPLEGFCRSTKSAVGAVFLEGVLWLCWFAFWFFVSFYKAPGPDEMEIDGDGSSIVRMGLSQHSASSACSGGERSRGYDSDLGLMRMPTIPAQWNQAESSCSSITPSADPHPPAPFGKGSQESVSAAPCSSSLSSSLASSSSSSLSTLHPDGRTMQRKQDKRLPTPPTQAASSTGTEVYLAPSTRARKAHPPAPPRINTAIVVQNSTAKFEGPRTRGSTTTGPPSSSGSSFSVRMPDASSASNRNSNVAPAIADRQSNRMSRSYSADIPIDSQSSTSAINHTASVTPSIRPRSISLGPSGTKAAASVCHLRPPPCPLPSANNNTNGSRTTNAGNNMDVGGKHRRNRPSSSEFVLLTQEDQQKVDLYWDGQLPYPPPPPLSPTSPSVGTFFSDLEDSEKEKVLKGTRLSFQLRQPQVRSSTQ